MRHLLTKGLLLFIGLAVLSSGLFIVPEAMAGGLKKVVAVSRFENRTSWGTGGQWDVGSGMADQLTDALMQSGQFTVLERQTLGDIVGEQDLAASGRTMQSKSARTGKLTSAQILIKGTVTEYSRNSKGSGAGVSFKGIKLGGSRGESHVGVIIRLIDTTTGEVLFSKRVEGKAKAGGLNLGVNIDGIGFGTESFKKTPLGKAMQITIDNAVEFIAEELRGVPFKGRVIKVTESEVYVSVGERNGATSGDKFTVYSVGEELVDPDTGEILGSEEEEIGRVEITKVNKKFSKARAVGGGISGISKGDVIREF
jgi:curli biogenesis system outer membrane secretion channel CsgG